MIQVQSGFYFSAVIGVAGLLGTFVGGFAGSLASALARARALTAKERYLVAPASLAEATMAVSDVPRARDKPVVAQAAGTAPATVGAYKLT